MSEPSRVKTQQIIVGGVGGQGVLFVTKLLAETALDMGCSVLISETHGMAQRGGIVISHLKVGKRSQDSGEHIEDAALISPLIRPGKADILMAIHPDAYRAHSFYLKPGGKSFRNDPETATEYSLDATAIAAALGSPISANIVLLGYAVGSGHLFCKSKEMQETLSRCGGKRLESSLRAFNAGLSRSQPPMAH